MHMTPTHLCHLLTNRLYQSWNGKHTLGLYSITNIINCPIHLPVPEQLNTFTCISPARNHSQHTSSQDKTLQICTAQINITLLWLRSGHHLSLWVYKYGTNSSQDSSSSCFHQPTEETPLKNPRAVNSFAAAGAYVLIIFELVSFDSR